jgi:glucose/mannose transport system substrate-binding protein
VADGRGLGQGDPAALQQFSKYDGHWIAAPVNVHSTNWVWINKAALDAAGGKAPETWDELVAVLDKMKANGITPIGHGGQPWQDATIFDALVLAWAPTSTRHRLHRPRPGRAGRRQMVEAFDKPDQAAQLCRRQLLGPRLEPGLGHGDQRRRPACSSWATGPRASS